MNGMFPGLLVDFGGVLTTSVFESFAAFAEEQGIPGMVFLEALADIGRTPNGLFNEIETGTIDLVEFERRLAPELSARLGRPISHEGLEKGLFALMGEDPAMMTALVAARRAGVKTALVSNSWGRDAYPRHRFDEMFDAVLISGEIGLRKPEPEIYLTAASMIGREPERCVFVDDMQVNVDGATAVGMQAILHRSASESLPEIERLIGVPLR
jgi:epoxide hydrolase-like predicted phosphatase